MSRKPRVAIFIDHDIIVRHFLMSGVFRALAGQAETTLVVPPPGDRRVTVDTAGLLDGATEHLPADPHRLGLWRWLSLASQLKVRPGQHYRAIRSLRRELIGWKASALLTLASLPGVHPLYRRTTMARLASRPNVALESLIARCKPDVLIHPSVLDGTYINDVIEAGRRHGIPSIVVMNSWDNPSTKGAVVGHPDWLLVWGPETRRHSETYLGMQPGRAVEFGTAQFDVFRGAPRLSREEFRARNHAPLDRPLVLYAGSSKGADEFGQIIEVDKAIREGRLPPMTVLYRPHPWGDGGKDGSRWLTTPFANVRIESTMRTYLERVAAGERKISLPDYRDTHDVLSNVDAVVSPLSTILIEAAMHGLPVMCQLPTDEKDAAHFRMVLPLVYVQDLLNEEAVIKAWGASGLLQNLPELLARTRDEGTPARMTACAAKFVTTFADPWPDRFAEFVLGTVLGGGRRVEAGAGGAQ